MGCGSSTSMTDDQARQASKAPMEAPIKEVLQHIKSNEFHENNKNRVKLELETEKDEHNIPSNMEDDPFPTPPPSTKAEFFNINKMTEIDRKAQRAPYSVLHSYESLIQYLVEDCQTDLEKVRSIFSWFGAQNINEMIFETAKIDTPEGFMNSLRLKRSSYASFFAKLCRTAGLPCAIVTGLGKSVAYQVGDKNLGRLRNQWNCVFVHGAWRIIHPLWAFSAIAGYKTGTWSILENADEKVNVTETASEGVFVQRIDEFYFLTDPEYFICSSFPDEEKWQLLDKPWTITQFENVPFFKESYFEVGHQLISEHDCVATSQDGVCVIEFEAPELIISKGYKMEYILYGDNGILPKILDQEISLDRYVFLNRIDNSFLFEIRFPIQGTYKIIVSGTEGTVCEFLLKCYHPLPDCKPLPVLPKIGWGPGPETEEIGLMPVSHTDGYIPISKRGTIQINFNSTRLLDIRTEVKHSTLDPSELQNFVKQIVKPKKIEFAVSIPEEGEYALQLYAREAKSLDDYKNFCNYLIRQSYEIEEDEPIGIPENKDFKEIARQRHIRKLLILQTKEDSIDKLGHIINVFEEHNMTDNGDLEMAKQRLMYLKLLKDLRDATMRRHLEVLENTVNEANNSLHKAALKPRIKAAEDLLEELKSFNRLGHEIRTMKQSTISEIRSYSHPPVVVHHVMMATFLLLGEKLEFVEEWGNVQALIGKTGSSSLKRKIKQFDVTKATEEQADDAKEYISEYNSELVREVSCGAAAFYVWTENAIQEVHSRGFNRAPPEEVSVAVYDDIVSLEKTDIIDHTDNDESYLQDE